MAKARPIPELTADMTFAEAARRTVAVRAGELREFAGDGVFDTSDTARVHDMRVATRRLRSVLELYAPCLDNERHARALKEVKRLADALGARRDPDVQLEALEGFRQELAPASRGGLELLAAQLRHEQEDGNAALARGIRRARRRGLDALLRELAEETA